MNKPIQSGIYSIRNTVNGKRYIGSAQNMARRKSQHYSDLRFNRHAASHLQHAYNKYGADVMVFEVIELCSIDLLLEHEQSYIDLYRTADRSHGYNTRPVAASNRGHVFSEEIRAKMRAGFNRNRKPMNAESRARCNETRRGRKVSEETRQRMREGNKLRSTNRTPDHIITEIRILHSQGIAKQDIAARFNINRRTVWRYTHDL
jgi:group I intron endonuclease